jgi:choline dehydrogenase-like flavoprotein
MKHLNHYEYIVIGTGPGGAPLAEMLASQGKKVLIVEKGNYHKHFLGFPFGMRMLDRWMVFSRSIEGVILERGITVGGSTMVYNANVFEPDSQFIKNIGIDFRTEINEILTDIDVQTLPERFFTHTQSTGGIRMREVAQNMGVPFIPQKKFVDPEKCRPGCDWCMLGCPYDAKWTTRKLIDSACESGAKLLYNASVDHIVLDQSKNSAKGIQLSNGKVIYGDHIILSAGGIGSPAIMQRSGIDKAGKRFFMDPMTVMFGLSRYEKGGCWQETTFSHAIHAFEKEHGFIIGNCGALGTFMVMNAFRPSVAVKNFYKLPAIRQGMGLFIKLAEDAYGEVFSNESVSKKFSKKDEDRMSMGIEIARDIMIKAGANPNSISTLKWAGGHPGGSLAMGSLVNHSFQTEIQHLYACDASILPHSPGIPPTVILLGLSRLMGKILLNTVDISSRKVQ